MLVTPALSNALLKTVLMTASFACAALLLRDGLALGLKVPLDPNEGWNAYHALAAVGRGALYPHDGMTNNYPPLSFYVVGALGKSLGDAIIAGRLVSLAAFAAVAMGLASLIRQVGGAVLEGIFASLFFAAALLITSDYVGIDDPQLLGHALQIEALVLLWRERPAIVLAALLMAAGLFVKQNLFVLPLAAAVWLAGQDRRALLRFCLYGTGLCIVGLLASWVVLDVNLLSELASPRLWTMANLTAAVGRYLSWAALPLAFIALMLWRFRRDPWMRFCALYAAIALACAIGFSAGDGVDANIFFDLDIAMALAAGLALGRMRAEWRGLMALCCTAPLALYLGLHFHDDNFSFTEAFQRQATPDIAFLALHDGPALCETLALCYWAGKSATVDVFNMSEQFKTGARSDDTLAAQLGQRKFKSLQFTSLSDFALGPKIHQALKAAYRVDHIDDNGAFLVPR